MDRGGRPDPPGRDQHPALQLHRAERRAAARQDRPGHLGGDQGRRGCAGRAGRGRDRESRRAATRTTTGWEPDQSATAAPLKPATGPGPAAEIAAAHESAALLDVSRTGLLLVKGERAEPALQQIVTGDVAALKPGQCQTGFMLDADGAVIDDVFVMRLRARRGRARPVPGAHAAGEPRTGHGLAARPGRRLHAVRPRRSAAQGRRAGDRRRPEPGARGRACGGSGGARAKSGRDGGRRSPD